LRGACFGSAAGQYTDRHDRREHEEGGGDGKAQAQPSLSATGSVAVPVR
jgi:hypothetical protein